MSDTRQLFFSLSSGIEVSTPVGYRTVKVALIAISCDLPARAIVLNMRQFNGRHGCHLCEDEGKTAANNSLFRWWPYNDKQELRTKDSLLKNAVEVTENDEIVS